MTNLFDCLGENPRKYFIHNHRGVELVLFCLWVPTGVLGGGEKISPAAFQPGGNFTTIKAAFPTLISCYYSS